jgi:hypothetical protein
MLKGRHGSPVESYYRLGLGDGATAGAGGIHDGTYRSCGENQGGGIGFAGAVIEAVVSAGVMASSPPRSTSSLCGASVGSPTHAAYKTRAMIPRIRRSASLRAIDRCAGRRIRNTLGSTDIIASERVTPGNSGTIEASAASTGGAGGSAFAGELLTLDKLLIERPLRRTGPPHRFRAVVDRINPGQVDVNISDEPASTRPPLAPNRPVSGLLGALDRQP